VRLLHLRDRTDAKASFIAQQNVRGGSFFRRAFFVDKV